MSENNQPKFETLTVHAGNQPDPETGATVLPIYQTVSFQFNDVEHAGRLFNLQEFGNIYSRLTNPTTAALETKIAALEGGATSLVTSSGHGAQLLTFHSIMEAGDEFVAQKELYGGSLNQFGYSFKKFDWNVNWANADDIESFKRAITDKTKAIFIESIANPGGIITDMEAIARIAQEAHIPFIVDNTLATPYLCQPINYGANIVLHSLTKFMGGHGNSLGGAIVDAGNFDWMKDNKFKTISEPNDAYHGMNLGEVFGNIAFAITARVIGLRDFGTCISPTNSFNINVGMETLALRMKQHVANSIEVAKYLEAHDKVNWVSYAGLESNLYYEAHKKYTPNGAGSVFTFGIKGGYGTALNFIKSVKMLRHVANIGDTRSLVIHPASTTHNQLSSEDRAAAGAGDDVIRLSIGIENAADIIADIEQALNNS